MARGFINNMLKQKTFTTEELLINWANSEDGTDYIISIVFDGAEWVIFYIEE